MGISNIQDDSDYPTRDEVSRITPQTHHLVTILAGVYLASSRLGNREKQKSKIRINYSRNQSSSGFSTSDLSSVDVDDRFVGISDVDILPNIVETDFNVNLNCTDSHGVFDMSSDQRLRLGPRTRSVVCAFDSGRRTRTPDSVRRFASDSVRPKKSQTEFLPVISDSVRGLMSVRDRAEYRTQKLRGTEVATKVERVHRSVCTFCGVSLDFMAE
ncbi:hypothetical protein LXL04_003036 [Taraxacum kok-saghyz]